MNVLKGPWLTSTIFNAIELLQILHGEAKSYCFTVSCVPESMLIIFSSFSDFLCFDMLRIKYNSQTLTWKKQSCG